MSHALYVRGVGLWPAASLGDKPAAALLPARMRGRGSPLTLMLAEVVGQAARGAGVDPGRLPSVFGSAYGEMHTTGSLLAQLSAAHAQLSPAKFQASVHNTAAAQLSIALHNPSFTTSIAAGHDSVAMSLIEAWAWLARNPGQVMVACADEAPNEVLQPGAAYPPLAAAFVLDSLAQRGLARIQLQAPDEQPVFAAELPSCNPVSSALTLAHAVLAAREQHSTTVLLNPSAPRGYRVSVEPVEAAHD
jgi:Beta-ketoacyl synthase, N-terminal domain